MNWEGTLVNGVEVGTAVGGNATPPDSPSLTASWGAENNLWLAVAGGADDDVAATGYPTGYTNGIDTLSGGGLNSSAEVFSSRRENATATEDPAAFTLASGEAWVANTIVIRPSLGAFGAERKNIIDGLDSAQAEGNGWDLVVKAGLAVTDVVRTSDTVVTITLPAFASYNITATETITAKVPATALVLSGSDVTGSPTFDVTADVPDLQQVHYRWRNDDGGEAGTPLCDETKVFLGTADTGLAGLSVEPVIERRKRDGSGVYAGDWWYFQPAGNGGCWTCGSDLSAHLQIGRRRPGSSGDSTALHG